MVDHQTQRDGGHASAALHTDAQPNSKTYRLLLKKISDQMTKRDLAALKFLCSDDIPSSKREKIQSTIGIIQELENMGLLCQENCSFLSELLFRIGRRDLLRTKMGLESSSIDKRLQCPSYRSHLSLFRIFLHKIGNEIPQKELENVKFLFQDDLSASALEMATDIWRLFGVLEMKEMIAPDNLESLLGVVEVIGRQDLRDNIHGFQEMQKAESNSPVNMKPPVQSYLARQLLDPISPREESNASQQHSVNTSDLLSRYGLASHGAPAEPEEPLPQTPTSTPVQASDDHGDTPYNIQWPPTGSMTSVTSVSSHNLQTPSYHTNDLGNPLPESGATIQEAAAVSVAPPQRNVYEAPPGAGDRRGDFQPAVPEQIPATPNNQNHSVTNYQPQGDLEATVSHLVLDTGNAQAPRQGSQMGLNQMPSAEAGAKTPPGPVPGNRMYLGTATQPLMHASSIPQAAGGDDIPSYKMTANPRGICIIINNAKFTSNPTDNKSKALKDRPGSEKDEKSLIGIFEKVGFRIQVYNNKSADQIQRILKLTSAMSFHDKDAIVICILSHGTYGAIYGSDGRKVQIGDVLHYFKADVCPSLAGKPKMFFIQACQGNQKTKASKIQIDDAGDQSARQELVAPDADFLIGYATVPGCVSYRHEDEGSWYINTLVNKLHSYCHRLDLLSIMTLVSQGVAGHDAPDGANTYKQVPLPYTTLLKQVHLRPVAKTT